MYVATPTSKYLDHLQCTGQTQDEAFNALIVACIKYDLSFLYSRPFYALIYEDLGGDVVKPEFDMDILEDTVNMLFPFSYPLPDALRELRVGERAVQVRRLVLGGPELPVDERKQKLRDALEEIARLTGLPSGDLKPGYIGRDLKIDAEGSLHPIKPGALLNSINTIAKRGLE